LPRPASRQGLRAEGANQRVLAHGGDDSAHDEATRKKLSSILTHPPRKNFANKHFHSPEDRQSGMRTFVDAPTPRGGRNGPTTLSFQPLAAKSVAHPPDAAQSRSLTRSRPLKWSTRRVTTAVFHLLRSGCSWRKLLQEYPPGYIREDHALRLESIDPSRAGSCAPRRSCGRCAARGRHRRNPP
jgi:transposase